MAPVSIIDEPRLENQITMGLMLTSQQIARDNTGRLVPFLARKSSDMCSFLHQRRAQIYHSCRDLCTTTIGVYQSRGGRNIQIGIDQ